jgi:ADP-dependent phosphofructokinase/glucokinase
LILRFSDEPIERDNAFARLTPQLPDVRAGLASGLNGPADDDGDSERWLRAVADRWRSADILVHHELAEFPSIARLAAALDIGLADSVGMSLSELTMLAGAGDPRLLSRAVVERARASRIIVHADEWALCVFRSDQRPAGATLLGGASLAAARARAGRPTSELVPADHAHFTDDLPVSGSLGDGWWATAVPIPYLRHPAATIGLGDTFTAGVLLVDSLPDSALVDLT